MHNNWSITITAHRVKNSSNIAEHCTQQDIDCDLRLICVVSHSAVEQSRVFLKPNHVYKHRIYTILKDIYTKRLGYNIFLCIMINICHIERARESERARERDGLMDRWIDRWIDG